MKVSLKLKSIQVMERLQRRTKKRLSCLNHFPRTAETAPYGYLYKFFLYIIFLQSDNFPLHPELFIPQINALGAKVKLHLENPAFNREIRNI